MARTPVTNSTTASARPRRQSLSTRNRLDVKDQDPNYHYRIVNDVDDRVSRLQELGYEVAPKETVGAVGSKRVDDASSLGSIKHFSVGQGTKAIVMRIPKEYAIEDQNVKLDEIAQLERTMYGDAKKASDYGTLENS